MTRMAGSKNVTDLLGIKPEYGAIGSQDIADTARLFASVTQGNELTTNAVLDGASGMAGTRYWGDATISSGAQAGLTDAVAGVASGVSGAVSLFPKGGLGGKPLGSFDPSTSTSNLFGNKIDSFGGGTPLGPLLP